MASTRKMPSCWHQGQHRRPDEKGRTVNGGPWACKAAAPRSGWCGVCPRGRWGSRYRAGVNSNFSKGRPMSLDFTAIDFETANNFRRSACAVGMTKVHDGQVVDRFASLIRPPDDAAEFTNTRVHGLTASDVAGAPRWPELLPVVANFIGSDYLVAHNASFDSSVFAHTTKAYAMHVESLAFVCTLRVARAMLSLGSYSLPFVVRELGLSGFQHHDASADSAAAAAVAVALASLASVRTIEELGRASSVGGFRGGPSTAVATMDEWVDVSAAECLAGESVCFTGALQNMTRDVAQNLVRALGGTVTEAPTKKTTILVTGDFDARTLKPGAKFSGKLSKAFSMAASGAPVRIVTEDEFMQIVDITADEVRDVKTAAVTRFQE